MCFTGKLLVLVALCAAATADIVQQCPNATAGTVVDTCSFACGCSCGNIFSNFEACVLACTARMTTQGLCAQLTDFPLGTGEGPCQDAEYSQADVCKRTCACCNKPPAACSCANSPDLVALRTVCKAV
ncbi:hypothetical protein AAVH_13947 [Aphelenchoides avenae]|nr:hypothetical protein AAVH_13947 [Aphelenchus avenae]